MHAKLTKAYKEATNGYELALGYPVNRCHSFEIDFDLLGIMQNTFASSYLNNIGSPYSTAKYATDNVKKLEVELINLLAQHLNLPQDDSFGYVTSGRYRSKFCCTVVAQRVTQTT